MPCDNEPYLYADNAATTPLSPRALDAMMPYLTSVFGNPSGIHRVSREAARALADARARMARLLGAKSASEIYFTSGGTEADNWVLRGAVRRFRDQHGDDAETRVITSAIEHHAVLHCCEALTREGVDVELLPVSKRTLATSTSANSLLPEQRLEQQSCSRRLSTESPTGCANRLSAPSPFGAAPEGIISPAALETALSGAPVSPALVSIMLANNEIGTIQRIRELADIAHGHGAPFHTDAVQAVGHIPVDVDELGVDALSLSAHKFHGPRGVGALYLREGFSIPSLVIGGAQERGVRAGTENVAAAVGMAAALEEACEDVAERMVRVAKLRDELVHRVLDAVPDVLYTGDAEHRLPSIASLVCKDVDGELLVMLLDRAGVAAATGSACSTGSAAPSHVVTALGIDDPRWTRGSLRLSLADDATEEDVATLSGRVISCIIRAREMSR